MRISDWSSDVCSSDLLAPAPRYRRNSPRIVDRIRNRLHMLTRFDPLELYAMLLGGMAAEEKAPFRELWGIVPDYRSEEHTSELQSLMRISYAVFCLKKKKSIRNTRA